MKKKLKRFSLVSKGINYKLRISFYLMSIIPILTSIYLISNYVLPIIGLKLSIGIVIVISMLIAIAGFFVIKEVTDTVQNLSLEAQKIAGGDLECIIEVRTDDEIGRLSESLNLLTQRIKYNMQELKGYEEQTQRINLEVQKRLIALSSLLQISSLISQGSNLNKILSLIVDRIVQLAKSVLSFIILTEDDILILKFASGLNSEMLLHKRIEKEGIFKIIFENVKPFILDKNTEKNQDYQKFQEEFRVKNSLLLPIFLKRKMIGILGIANSEEDFQYSPDDLDLLDIFSKQSAIAIENDLLAQRIKGLEIRDTLTGLYNERFIKTRLQEEIKRAIVSQRPCGFILLEVDNFREFHDSFGGLETESILKKVSSILEKSISEIDYLGRTGDNEFSIILPEKNKKRTFEVAEEIRKRIEFAFLEEESPEKRLTISGAVTENPLDGEISDELIDKAKSLLSLAKKQGKNRICI